jgi:hypothetical protein
LGPWHPTGQQEQRAQANQPDAEAIDVQKQGTGCVFQGLIRFTMVNVLPA